MDAVILAVKDLTVRLGGTIILENINFTIRRGEQWAITGHSGSGKTTFAHSLTGRHFHGGQVVYDPGENHRPIEMVEQQHRFKNLSNTSDLYYQQRFNASDAGQTATVEQELMEYLHDGNIADNEWVDILHIRTLLQRPLIQLSNGENKRVQLAIAMFSRPGLLILDNPFLGLDREGRKTLQHIFNTLAEKGIHLLLITAAQEIPATITHVASLDHGKIVFSGKKEDFHPVQAVSGDSMLNTELLKQLKPASTDVFSSAVKMIDVNIVYGENTILSHINWEVKKGEKWSVSGPNGAGKSTLLSLITADNPQAYANEIYLFDRKRGSGESIWDIKKRIGFVSPELHLYFDFSATCFEVIASGLFDTIGLFKRLSDEQEEKIALWMKLLQLEEIKSRRLTQLSAGQQRMVLLARSLIKNPPLLILDEPCQGLDDEQTIYFKNLVNQLCTAFNSTLIYVSHYRHQIPECVDHFLQLEKGNATIIIEKNDFLL